MSGRKIFICTIEVGLRVVPIAFTYHKPMLFFLLFCSSNCKFSHLLLLFEGPFSLQQKFPTAACVSMYEGLLDACPPVSTIGVVHHVLSQYRAVDCLSCRSSLRRWYNFHRECVSPVKTANGMIPPRTMAFLERTGAIAIGRISVEFLRENRIWMYGIVCLNCQQMSEYRKQPD